MGHDDDVDWCRCCDANVHEHQQPCVCGVYSVSMLLLLHFPPSTSTLHTSCFESPKASRQSSTSLSSTPTRVLASAPQPPKQWLPFARCSLPVGACAPCATVEATTRYTGCIVRHARAIKDAHHPLQLVSWLAVPPCTWCFMVALADGGVWAARQPGRDCCCRANPRAAAGTPTKPSTRAGPMIVTN